ncbi:MAG: hypothetical protein C7B46_04870 [Sulfobacillus benefaciens]|uniref:GAF domain-containing protein n=1 Tax=Sulfobacillus benefaciens TaxID=453960 RepID=A0A2T2XIY7_9FIRM|nr:MAG: hypothetical protein C7B46_04870 [Sulfobacillus benefaciens]
MSVMHNKGYSSANMLTLLDTIGKWVSQIDSDTEGIYRIHPHWPADLASDPIAEALSGLLRAIQQQMRQVTVQHAASVKIMGQLAEDIASLAPLQEVLQRICDTARYLLASDIGYIALLNDAKDAIVVQAGSGVSPALIGVRQRLGQGIGGRVILTKRPTVFKNYPAEVRRDPEVENAIDREHIISAIAVPLIRGDHAIGVLYTAMRSIHEYGPEEIELAANLAMLASVAIHNAALYDQTAWLMKINQEFAQIALIDNVLDHICVTLGKLTNSRVSVLDSRALPIAMGNRTVWEIDEVTGPLKKFFSQKSSADYSFTTPRNEVGILSPLDSRRGIAAVLALVKHPPYATLSERDFVAIDRAKHFLELGLNQLRLRHEVHLAATSAFLQNVIGGHFSAELLADQARQLQLDRPDRYGLLVAYVGSPSDVSLHRVAIQEMLAGVRIPIQHHSLVASMVEDNCFIGLSESSSIETMATYLHETLTALVAPYPVWIAVGEPCPQWLEYSRQWHNCLTTLQWHSRVRPQIPVISSTEYGLIGVLFDASNVDQVKRFCDVTLGPLYDYDQQAGSDLLHTLLIYLDHECELRSSATALHIHYNTLRYRLQQIASILSIDLEEHSTRQQLRMALWCQEAFGFLSPASSPKPS